MRWDNGTLRERERASIRAFVEANSGKLTGRVLDYGCGRQPYRDVVDRAGGAYHGYDRKDYPGAVVGEDVGGDWPLRQQWDAILCNQIIQFIHRPHLLLRDFHAALSPGGWLVMTGPTNWPEVENEDIWRVTAKGIACLLRQVGFVEVSSRSRETMMVNDIPLSLGWGVTGQKAPGL